MSLLRKAVQQDMEVHVQQKLGVTQPFPQTEESINQYSDTSMYLQPITQMELTLERHLLS